MGSKFYYWKARLAYACFLDSENDFERDKKYRAELLREAHYYQMIARRHFNREHGIIPPPPPLSGSRFQ